MTPEEWLLDETRGWVRRAEDDLRAAAALIAAELPAEALYHCQQSAEKYIKAFLTRHQKPFRKTHDLRELAVGCADIDPDLALALRPALDLTQYAWRFRYPGTPFEPDEPEVALGLQLAQTVREEILKRLSETAHMQSAEAVPEEPESLTPTASESKAPPEI
ncbi:MAG: HEPN domain-containing protein [Bryobacteraceae bacterium]|jgi:HEPN domain-containing protein